ncbi:MAG: hypothetical protein RLZ98_16 [Pseudomonadota bacterium]|jgi:hypothetical protein
MPESEDGYQIIEVRVRARGQLFNSLDPSPFIDRDLDDEAESHIVGWARELPQAAPIRLLIYLPAEEARNATAEGVPAALNNYFGLRADAAHRDLKDLFALGWRYLAIGIPILISCLTASQFMQHALGPGTFARIMEESLIIVGWVANWRPIETFLYDWWPIARRIRLYRRLEQADVRIVPV